MEMKDIGKRIHRKRIEKGWCQEELAEKLSVSRQAVSKWEIGSSDPSTTNLIALAKLFGVTAEELLKETQ